MYFNLINVYKKILGYLAASLFIIKIRINDKITFVEK